MQSISRLLIPLLVSALALAACGGNTSGSVLFVDAEYDPAGASDTNAGVHESALAVAQTFTVLSDGKLDEFQIVITQGVAGSQGIIRVDVRPVLATGEPETDDTNSIITPIDIDTTTLPATLVDDFTIFDVSDEPGRDVLMGEEFAIVVTFLSRSAGNTDESIALMLGRTGDEYADGSGSLDPDGLGFTNNAFDYFFRTFVRR